MFLLSLEKGVSPLDNHNNKNVFLILTVAVNFKNQVID